MNRKILAGMGLAFAAFFGWGLLSPIGKILLVDFEPMGLNAVRMTVATIILFPLVGKKNILEGIDVLRRPPVFATVLIGGGIGFTAFVLAVDKIDATYATFGFFTAPLWTAILANWKLNESVGRTFFPAFLILAAGGWFAMGGSNVLPVGIDKVGMGWAIASGVLWAIYSVRLRQHTMGIGMRPLMVATFLVSTVYFIVLAVLTEGYPTIVGHSAPTWGWMVLYAVVPTIGALWLFNMATKRAPVSILNIFISVELASAALLSYLLLGDEFTQMQIVGLGISLFAVSWYLWTRRVLYYAPNEKAADKHEKNAN